MGAVQSQNWFPHFAKKNPALLAGIHFYVHGPLFPARYYRRGPTSRAKLPQLFSSYSYRHAQNFFRIKYMFRIARAGIFPRSSLLGAGQVGFWEFGRGGSTGEGWGERGQFTSNLRGRWTIPITTGGCQVSRGGCKGNTKGCKGTTARGRRAIGNAPYIYVIVLYVQWND